MAPDGSFQVERTTDPAVALAALDPLVAARPVEHNVLATVVRDEVRRGATGGSYWFVRRGIEAVGAAMQTGPAFPMTLSAMAPAAARALADDVARIRPDLPLVIGTADAAASFAGQLASCLRRPVSPVAAQRIYRLGRLVPPANVPGQMRAATARDRERLVEWTVAFRDEAGVPMGSPEDVVDGKLALGLFRLWEDGGAVVSVVAATEPAAGWVRVQNVYTPPEHRGRGYAAALVAAQAAEVRAVDRADLLLYTDLANPTSNGVYQRIGFEPVAELVAYEFGPCATACPS